MNADYVDYMKSPIGVLVVTANNKNVVSILFEEKSPERNPNKITVLAIAQLNAYFDSELTAFDLPLELNGTSFQKSVWKALDSIPFGETRSYGDIAGKIKNQKAVRAVGAANGKNPMTIVLPCHRVIGADGSMTGYASGVERKKWLLNHEGIAV